ncbi:Initiation factor eIF-4 gamma MA3, partial [Trinorchestia longiramus]
MSTNQLEETTFYLVMTTTDSINELEVTDKIGDHLMIDFTLEVHDPNTRTRQKEVLDYKSKIRSRSSRSRQRNRSRSKSIRKRRSSSSSSSSSSSNSSSSSSASSRKSPASSRKISLDTVSAKKKETSKTSQCKEKDLEKSEATVTNKLIDEKSSDNLTVKNRDRDEHDVSTLELKKDEGKSNILKPECSTVAQSSGKALTSGSPASEKNITCQLETNTKPDTAVKHKVQSDVVMVGNKTEKSAELIREEKQACKISNDDKASKSEKEVSQLPGQRNVNSPDKSNRQVPTENSFEAKRNELSSDDEDRPLEYESKGQTRRHSSSEENKSVLGARAEKSDSEESIKTPARKKRKSKSPSSERHPKPSDVSEQENSDSNAPKNASKKIHSRDVVKNSSDESSCRMELNEGPGKQLIDNTETRQKNKELSKLKKGMSKEQEHSPQGDRNDSPSSDEQYQKNKELSGLKKGMSKEHERSLQGDRNDSPSSDEQYSSREGDVNKQRSEKDAGEVLKDKPVEVDRKTHTPDNNWKKIPHDSSSSESSPPSSGKNGNKNNLTKTKDKQSVDGTIEFDSEESVSVKSHKKREHKVKNKKKANLVSSETEDSDSGAVVPEKKAKKRSKKKKAHKKLDEYSDDSTSDDKKKFLKRNVKKSKSKKGHKQLQEEREEGALSETDEDEKEIMRKKKVIEEQLIREMEIKDRADRKRVDEKLAEVRDFEKRHAEVKERENRYTPKRPDRDEEVIGERYWGAKASKESSNLSKSSDTYWNKYADELGIQIEEPRRREDGRGNREQNRENRKRDDREPEAKRAKLDGDKNMLEERNKPADAIKKAVVDPLQTRTGGAYIPPAKLRMMQAEITDKSSAAFQRLAWEALKKSVNGLVNKVNVSNIGIIVRELLKENVVRGRGILCRSLMQAQAFSMTFTHVYAALVAVLNSKFPQIGLLILNRLIIQFRRGIKRNDKNICLSSSRFIAHLMNQQVAHEVVALEILTFLLEKVLDLTDTTEVGDKSRNNCAELAVAFLRECGQKLQQLSPRCIIWIYDNLKNVINEGKLDERVRYMCEAIWVEGRHGFKDNPAVAEELDLVEEDDQITHIVELDGKLDSEDILNVYKHDPDYEVNEEKYKEIKASLLGESSGDEGSDEDESGSSGSESDDEDESKTTEAQEIIDKTEANMLAFRRAIYLTLRSSLTVDEATHKILKGEIKPGWEMELGNMILDCCAQERTFIKFFALIAQRFCNINRVYRESFQEIFKNAYETCHRLDTDKLRNVARFFAHLLVTDAISWEVFSVVLLNEDNTTSSSRVFLKILFQ